LSEAETIGIIAGHQRLMSYNRENFRNLYAPIIRYMGEKGNVKNFWPLPTDEDSKSKYTREYLDKRNKEGLEFARKIGFYTN
jgi:hypothetical protein